MNERSLGRGTPSVDGLESDAGGRTGRRLQPGEVPEYQCTKIWNAGIATKLWSVPKEGCSEEQAKLRLLTSIVENPGYTIILRDSEASGPIMAYQLDWDRENANESLVENYVQEHRTEIYGRASDKMPKRWWEVWKGGRDLAPNVKEGDRGRELKKERELAKQVVKEYLEAARGNDPEALARIEREENIDPATTRRALAIAAENGATRSIEHLGPKLQHEGINVPTPGEDPDHSVHVLEHAGRAKESERAATREQLVGHGALYERTRQTEQEREHRIVEAAGLGFANTVQQLAPLVRRPALNRAMSAAKSQLEQHDDKVFDVIVNVLRSYGAKEGERDWKAEAVERVTKQQREHPQGKLAVLWRGEGWDIAWSRGKGHGQGGHIVAAALDEQRVEQVMQELGLVRNVEQLQKLRRELAAIRNEQHEPQRRDGMGR